MAGIKLFVGLGNPGEAHQNTRHNAGFWWLDFVAKNHRLSFKNNSKFFGFFSKNSENGEYYLLKPTTFMNESGKSVAAFANFYKLKPEEILIIHDELDLKPGKIKLKLSGGHGGHNGLKSISSALQSNNYWRLRIGIGHPGDKNLVSNYVLKKPQKLDDDKIQEAIFNSYKIFSLLVTGQFNKSLLNLHSN